MAADERGTMPGYEYYRDVYGGSISPAAYAEAGPASLRLMRSLTGIASEGCVADERDRDAWARAACAAADAFAEFGEGLVGGFELGDFRITSYMDRTATGRDIATASALEELSGSCLIFSGVKR